MKAASDDEDETVAEAMDDEEVKKTSDGRTATQDDGTSDGVEDAKPKETKAIDMDAILAAVLSQI